MTIPPTYPHDENCWCARCIKRLTAAHDRYFLAWLLRQREDGSEMD